MPRPLPALPGASEPPERPNSAASNASHPKEYRMMALQQIRNSLEPFANQQEQLLHQFHHGQMGGGVSPVVGQYQLMKRSEMSSASSTASESSYGYSAFNALPPKTPVRPPEVVQRSQSCGPRKPPARLPPEQPSGTTDERLSTLTNGAAAFQQQRAANQSALLGLKALRLTSATPDPTGTPLWEKLPVSISNCATTSSSANSAASDSGVESSPSVRNILPDPPRLLQTGEYYQPTSAPVLYPKNVPSGEAPPPPPPRPDRHAAGGVAPPPIQGPKPQAAVAKKYSSTSHSGHPIAGSGTAVQMGGVPQREPPPPYTIYSPPSISSTYSALSYASSSSGGRLSPTNTGSSSECSIPILPRRTPPPVSPQPSVASMASSISLPSSALSCPPKPTTNGVSGGGSHCLQAVPPPQQAASWAVKKAKSQSPIIMHSVKATPIQKPVPQTAVAPPSRPVPPVPSGTSGCSIVGGGAPSGSGTSSYGTPPPYPPPAYPRRSSAGQTATAAVIPIDQQSLYVSSTPPPLPPPRTVSPPPLTVPSTANSLAGASTSVTIHSQPPHHPLLLGMCSTSGRNNNNNNTNNSNNNNHSSVGGGSMVAVLHSNQPAMQTPSSSSSATGSAASLCSSIASSSIPISVPTTEPPSYASSVAALAAAAGTHKVPSVPPPPPIASHTSIHHSHSSNMSQQQKQQPLTTRGPSSDLVGTVSCIPQNQLSALQGTTYSQENTNVDSSSSRSESPVTDMGYSIALQSSSTGGVSSETTTTTAIGHVAGGSDLSSNNCAASKDASSPEEPIRHQSPIPPRKKWSVERDDAKVRNYSPDAYKFFMEQHVENVMKNHQQRQQRRQQLETEMARVGLSSEAQMHMRRMLHQKESNYIRLRRAKMEISMFHKIAIIGMGAFGEVALVKKVDTQQLYAMKTLRKEDVLKRNQVAHVKAERDILAEADNEWVVKLYYSFQDQNSLYFVMDYIAGGDMMTLLIKFGVFEESLARFYIAELTCALESVHKLGFIHRDIKPDNILIDRDGHIKLTDFGLCTGFRWTHNSKYYQRGGDHARQDSMDFNGCEEDDCSCKKPLERRRRKDQQRSLARSLVGTPNYIAPEVLLRQGYGQACDWWSVGVILYEMLIGQAPFHAPKPAETQYKVINWETHLTFPPLPQLSPEASSLIKALCTSQERRLGAKGAHEIKAHPFFAGIDFEGGVRKTTAPYIPQIRYPADTSNFDKYEMPLSGMDDTTKGLNGIPPERDGEHAFLEFTFRRFFDDGGQAYPLRFAGQIQEEQESPQVDAKGNPVYV